MIYYPLQSFGAGDVIFTQTLIRKLAGQNRIVWGVESHFVEGLNRAYPDILFIDRRLINVDYERRSEHEQFGMKILPIRWADAILNVPYEKCMRAKYDLYNQPWENWKENAMWCRDTDRENKLYRILNPSDNPYILTNRFFGSDSQLQANIEQPGIEMKTINGYSLFDWAKLIENATEIHTVSTSIVYLLELLDLKAKEVHLYTRKPIEPHFRNIDYILQKKYIFHY